MGSLIRKLCRGNVPAVNVCPVLALWCPAAVLKAILLRAAGVERGGGLTFPSALWVLVYIRQSLLLSLPGAYKAGPNWHRDLCRL